MVMKTCYYDVLNVSQTASFDEITKSYRNLALKYHPDKNTNDENELYEKFILIQEAYDILSDKKERLFYDQHKDCFSDEDDNNGISREDPFLKQLNIFKLLNTKCFNGFTENVAHDSSKPYFFKVYGDAFRAIYEEENRKTTQNTETKKKDSKLKVPLLGNLNSSAEDVNKFYSYWRSFNSQRPFYFADLYGVNSSYNRHARRQIEFQNKTARNQARRRYNRIIHTLVEWVRKHDPRVVNSVNLQNINSCKDKKHRSVISQKNKVSKGLCKSDQLINASANKDEMINYINLEYSNNLNGRNSIVFEIEKKDEMNKYTDIKVYQTDLMEKTVYKCCLCKKFFHSESQYRMHERSRKHLQSSLYNTDYVINNNA